jgi:hypothetical protein
MKLYVCDGCDNKIDGMNVSYELKRKEGRMSHSFGLEEKDKHFCSHDCISNWANQNNKQTKTVEVIQSANVKKIATELIKYIKDNDKRVGRL